MPERREHVDVILTNVKPSYPYAVSKRLSQLLKRLRQYSSSS